MIDKNTRQKIEKELGEQEDLDSYFRECYRLIQGGKDYIVLHPHSSNGGDLTMMFDEETGEFIGLQPWSWTKEHGEMV